MDSIVLLIIVIYVVKFIFPKYLYNRDEIAKHFYAQNNIKFIILKMIDEKLFTLQATSFVLSVCH
jgi:hypothetical protein